MQALYAFFQHEKADLAFFERELFKSLDKIYDLYLSILALLADMHHVSLVVIDENKNKRLPTEKDLDPNLKFCNNVLLVSLSNNNEFKNLLEKRKINWQEDFDLIRKLYNELRVSDEYKVYMNSGISSVEEDRDFILAFITDELSEHDLLNSLFEEKNIHWADDNFVAFNSVIRNLETFEGEFKLQALLKDEKDDLEFMSILFQKTIIHKDYFRQMIEKHTQNWDVERIANMDMLLMEMALAEILHLPNIPIKASLNEYIDISKEYSTPNSKVFVNGMLDKIIAELRRENKIEKTGRGLKES
jgi:transcription antitermination protein NusB